MTKLLLSQFPKMVNQQNHWGIKKRCQFFQATAIQTLRLGIARLRPHTLCRCRWSSCDRQQWRSEDEKPHGFKMTLKASLPYPTETRTKWAVNCTFFVAGKFSLWITKRTYSRSSQIWSNSSPWSKIQAWKMLNLALMVGRSTWMKGGYYGRLHGYPVSDIRWKDICACPVLSTIAWLKWDGQVAMAALSLIPVAMKSVCVFT